MQHQPFTTISTDNVVLSWRLPGEIYGRLMPAQHANMSVKLGNASEMTASLLAAVILYPSLLPLYVRSLTALAEMIGEEISKTEGDQ